MALDKTLDNLQERLDEMRDTLMLVRQAVDDRPEEHQLERALDAAVLELMSTMHDAHKLFQRDRGAERRADLERELRALRGCHQRCLDLNEQLLSLARYERLEEIMRFGHERSHEWPGWADTVVAQISACQESWMPLHRALLDCWQELSERLAIRTPSANATAIGQQIHLANGKQSSDFELEAST